MRMNYICWSCMLPKLGNSSTASRSRAKGDRQAEINISQVFFNFSFFIKFYFFTHSPPVVFFKIAVKLLNITSHYSIQRSCALSTDYSIQRYRALSTHYSIQRYHALSTHYSIQRHRALSTHYSIQRYRALSTHYSIQRYRARQHIANTYRINF